MGQNGQNRVRARVRKEIPIFFCICGRSNGLEAQSIATLTLWQAHPTFLKKLFYFLLSLFHLLNAFLAHI